MEWRILEDETGAQARGREHDYLVTGDLSVDQAEVTGVRLTRWRRFPGGMASVRDASRNVIVFPLGRGPGRPAGEPEIAALMQAAKNFAETFESGRDLEGYAAWQHYKVRFGPIPEGTRVHFYGDHPGSWPRDMDTPWEGPPSRGGSRPHRDYPASAARQRLKAGALRFTCETCGAAPGHECRTADGLPTAGPHAPRQDAYRREAGLLEDGQ